MDRLTLEGGCGSIVYWRIAPAIPVPREFVVKYLGIEFKGDNTHSIRDLGRNYHPAETTLVEHFKQIVEDGLV